tara:strand:+ start:160 stop:570 length:411 start_codon:yes stop_codon:yes gene_type:complete
MPSQYHGHVSQPDQIRLPALLSLEGVPGVSGEVGRGSMEPSFKPAVGGDSDFNFDWSFLSEWVNEHLLGGNQGETVSSRAGRGDIPGASAIDAVFGEGHTAEAAMLWSNNFWPCSNTEAARKAIKKSQCSCGNCTG